MIKFGTDGWRGIISEDFTFSNVRLVASAISDYVLERGEAVKGIVVGYDTRFLSRQYAEECSAVISERGLKVWLADSILPTPALTWQVKDRQSACGIMVTASHNPYQFNGLKIKTPYGGSASQEIISNIEKYVRRHEASGCEYPKASLFAAVDSFSPRESYLDHVAAMLDADLLSSFKGKIIFDVMHGAASGYAASLGARFGLDLAELRNGFNLSFGGVNPEPIEQNLASLRKKVRYRRAVLGLATDGDGDRIGAVDANGRFITPHQIIALLTKYLVEKRGWTGGVAKTLTVSELVRRIAAKYRVKIYETPVGFKHIAHLMLNEDILIGGEESGGIGIKNYIPERDGLLLGFMLIEVMGAYGKPLGILVDEMMGELGQLYYKRKDLHLKEEQKARLITSLVDKPPEIFEGMEVLAANCDDGCKLYLDGGWVMIRASGTEPIVRIYAEAKNQMLLDIILSKAMNYAAKA